MKKVEFISIKKYVKILSRKAIYNIDVDTKTTKNMEKSIVKFTLKCNTKFSRPCT